MHKFRWWQFSIEVSRRVSVATGKTIPAFVLNYLPVYLPKEYALRKQRSMQENIGFIGLVVLKPRN